MISGLSVFTYWETYVAALLYLVIFMGPLILVGVAMERAESAAGLIGCLTMLVMPVLQTFALVVFVLTLSPIMLGLKPDAAWTFPWMLAAESPGGMAKMVGILFLAAVVISFLPLLGRWHSLHTAVLGSLALAFVLAMIEKANPGIATGRVALWPGFWFFLGLVVVGSVMAWLGILLAALLSTAFEIAVEPLEGVGQLLMIPVGAVFGFIPVFMYGAYLGAQLRAGG
jgi:hypothetical protein